MSLKQYDYHCSNCNQRLNVMGSVILYIERSNGQCGVVELHPTPGEYNFTTDPVMEFEKNEKVDFFCPACKANLQDKNHPDFVDLKLHVNDNVYFDVLFSRIFGDRKTYVITEEMTEKFGDNPIDLD